MITHSGIVLLIIPLMLGVLLLARYGLKQDRVARAVPPKPGSTSGLAIAAFVLAFLVPVVGVVLGHVALHRIGRGLARGRPWADRALVVGYVLILVEVLLVLIFYPGLRWFEPTGAGPWT